MEPAMSPLPIPRRGAGWSARVATRASVAAAAPRPGGARLAHERRDRPSGDPGPVAPLTPVRLLRGPARATRHAPTAALVPTAQQPAVGVGLRAADPLAGAAGEQPAQPLEVAPPMTSPRCTRSPAILGLVSTRRRVVVWNGLPVGVALEAEGAGAARVRHAILDPLVIPQHQPLRLVLGLPPRQRPRGPDHHPPRAGGQVVLAADGRQLHAEPLRQLDDAEVVTVRVA